MRTVQVGEMKANLSEILERIRTEGEEFVLEFGRGHEKVAVLVPYEKYRQQQRTGLRPGLLRERAAFAFSEDSALRDEDLLGEP